MINCQNLFSEPLDPVMIGAHHLGLNDVMIKGYDSCKLNFMPSNARFAAESETGSLEIIHVDTVTDYNKSQSKTPLSFKPRYLYLVDFVVKFDFLSGADFRKNFNYMQKYY